ncbi:MAG: type II toxin-antitoxin system RelE/ParE family toxin [Nanoarchaeota archaeon]|nr:type II toxin-antitoxin system RelE/ParE family toxin [Nanoarchaeota archaeon]
MFGLEWKEGSIRQLNKLPSLLSCRILKKVEELKEDPFSKDIKKLKGEPGFRLRVGDYRVIFDIDFRDNLISVLRLGYRKNIYKN